MYRQQPGILDFGISDFSTGLGARRGRRRRTLHIQSTSVLLGVAAADSKSAIHKMKRDVTSDETFNILPEPEFCKVANTHDMR